MGTRPNSMTLLYMYRLCFPRSVYLSVVYAWVPVCLGRSVCVVCVLLGFARAGLISGHFFMGSLVVRLQECPDKPEA